jgi:ketosteroid isomerase-like protein
MMHDVSRWLGRRPKAGTSIRSAAVAAMLLILLGPLMLPAAQKNNKKDSKDNKQSDAVNIASLMPLPDSQDIEIRISQMLAAWQIGDEQLLHSFYADDVLVVSGAWEPPLQGWQNYLRAYEAQRARAQGARLDRTNTFTKVLGNMAWSTYQWQFNGQVDGVPTNAVGQTTLVFERRAGKWLIVLNHTSVSPRPPSEVPSTAAPASGTSQPSPLASTGAPGA